MSLYVHVGCTRLCARDVNGFMSTFRLQPFLEHMASCAWLTQASRRSSSIARRSHAFEGFGISLSQYSSLFGHVSFAERGSHVPADPGRRSNLHDAPEISVFHYAAAIPQEGDAWTSCSVRSRLELKVLLSLTSKMRLPRSHSRIRNGRRSRPRLVAITMRQERGLYPITRAAT